MEWHIITCEYPPLIGGVSDHTRLVAEGLAAAGDSVQVWCPAGGEASAPDGSVSVRRELGSLRPADLRRVGRLLDGFAAPRRLLVQWVPHGYGYHSMNLHLCLWLWSRAAFKGDRVELVVHEPFLALGEGSWKQSIAGIVHRVMAAVLLGASNHVWVTIPKWAQLLRPYALGRRLQFTWLPVASNIPVHDACSESSSTCEYYANNGELVVGHFGTYGLHVKRILLAAVPALMKINERVSLLLLGRGSEDAYVALIREHPELHGRIRATGELDNGELSRAVRACDLMFQPYPDGISSRRTSAMLALSHGIPIVTTSGHLTEPFWAESRAVVIVPVTDTAALVNRIQCLLLDAAAREAMSVAAKRLYLEYFQISRVVNALSTAT